MIPLDLTQQPVELPVNMFLHPTADNGKPAMVNFPGYLAMDDVTTGKVQDCCAWGVYSYWLIADTLYHVVGSTANTLVSKKADFIGSATKNATMITDGTYVCAVCGDAYVYWYKISDSTNNKVDVSGITGGSATTGLTLQDGYFIACGPYGNNFCISDLNDPTTWNALNFEDEEYKPDVCVNVYSFQRKLFVFGTDTYVVYENTGNTDFPFERIPGAVFDVGIGGKIAIYTTYGAEKTAIECNGELYFMASDNTIKRIRSFEHETVSTAEVNKYLKDFRTSTCWAWTALVDGMWFYAISNGTYTLALNTATGQWIRLASGTDGASNYPATCSLLWNQLSNSVYKQKTFMGLGSGGEYVLLGENATTNFYSEDGAAQYREIQTQVIEANRERMYMGQLEVWAKKYVGSTTVNPTLSVSWSDDGGTTFSTARTLYLGLSGGTGDQLRTFMLGSSYNRIFKFSSSNIYELQLYGGYLS